MNASDLGIIIIRYLSKYWLGDYILIACYYTHENNNNNKITIYVIVHGKTIRLSQPK